MDWKELKKTQWMGLAIVLLITIYFLATFPYKFGLTDQVERYRVQQEIIQTNSIPSYIDVYGTPTPNVYPPLLDVIGAGLQSIGFSFEQSNDFIAIVLVALLYYFLFRLMKLSFDDWTSASGALLGTLAVPVYRQLLHPIAGSVGFVLLAALVYYTFQKKFSRAAILAWLLSLTHLRTLGVFAVFFTVWCAWELYNKRLDWKSAWKPFAGIALGLLLWFGTRPPGWVLNGVSNPWVSQPNPLIFFSALGLLAFLGIIELITQYARNRKNFWDWSLTWMVAIVALYAFSDPINSMRVLFFAFIPLAFLGAQLLQPWLIGNRYRWFSLAILTLAVLVMLQNISFQENRADYFNDERIELFQHLQNVRGNGIVSDHMASYLAATYSGKNVVAGPFLEEVSDGTARATETFEFFRRCEPDFAFLNKYHANLVVFTEFVTRKTGCTLEKFDPQGKYSIVLRRGSNAAVHIPTIQSPEVLFSEDCNELKAQIMELLNQANSCDSVSDCGFGPSISTRTQERCFGLANENYDFTIVKEGFSKYYQICEREWTNSDCGIIPPPKIVCESNKCAVR